MVGELPTSIRGHGDGSQPVGGTSGLVDHLEDRIREERGSPTWLAAACLASRFLAALSIFRYIIHDFLILTSGASEQSRGGSFLALLVATVLFEKDLLNPAASAETRIVQRDSARRRI